jgi:hypothetical protein
MKEIECRTVHGADSISIPFAGMIRIRFDGFAPKRLSAPKGTPR